MHFLDWIHRLRDFDNEDTIKELLNYDENWEPFESDSTLPEYTLDSSRISVNLTPVKKQLNESLHQLSMNNSFLDISADKTADTIVAKRQDDMNACLMQMELATKTLGKLCHQYESRKTSGEVTKSLDKVKILINTLRNVLDSKHSLKNHDEDDDDDNNTQESDLNNTTVIENSTGLNDNNKSDFIQKLEQPLRSPGKSSTRGCPFFQDSTTTPAKSVRFNIQ